MNKVLCIKRVAGNGGHAALQLHKELASCAVDGAQVYSTARRMVERDEHLAHTSGLLRIRLRSQALPMSVGCRRSYMCGLLLHLVVVVIVIIIIIIIIII